MFDAQCFQTEYLERKYYGEHSVQYESVRVTY